MIGRITMETSTKFSEKSKRRKESKIKKAEAFLSLVGHKKTWETSQSSDTSLLSTSYKPDESAHLMDSNQSKQSDDPVEEMKALIRERKKAIMQKPKVFLTLEEMVLSRPLPLEPVTEDEIPPLFVMDLQQLLLWGIQGNMASYKPRWCKILRIGRVKSVVLLTVDGVSFDDFKNNKHNFRRLDKEFENVVEMVNPRQYGFCVEDELVSVPLSVSQLKKVNVKVPITTRRKVAEKIAEPIPVKPGNVGKITTEAKKEKKQEAVDETKLEDNPSDVREITQETKPTSTKAVEQFSRKCLLMSTYQLMEEGYPLPVKTHSGKYAGFKFSKDRYDTVRPDSPLYALDCEMCLTTLGKNELTRVSIVSEAGETIYDELVKPRNRIVNYLTRYSGITKKMLDPVTTTIEQVQIDIKNLLPADAILCGQSLNCDLIALKMFHPYVIDTSVIFNMSGCRKVKAGLRKLTQFFLGRTIQDSKDGHCSAEDATATLDLVKLKLSKGLEFGDATISGIYFPDIRTYFLGGKDGVDAVSENVEKEGAELPAVIGDSSQQNKNKEVNGKESSSQISEDSSTAKHSEINKTVGGVQSQNGKNRHISTSSSSSSSEEEVENDDKEEEAPSEAKKRKIESGDPNQNGAVVELVSSPSKKVRTEIHTDKTDSKSQKVKTDLKTERKMSVSDEVKPETAATNTDAGTTEVNNIPQSDTPTPIAPSGVSTQEFVKSQQALLFRQYHSVHVPHSFFQLTREAGRTACMIGSEAGLAGFQSEPTEKQAVESDHQTKSAAIQAVKEKEFVWAQFQGGSMECEEDRDTTMRRVDKRVSRVLRQIPPNALVVVLLKGRVQEGAVHNMAAFLKTT